MPSSHSESVTVTVLPDVFALVHIPRSRLKYFSHQVVKQILTPAPSFLNITCNKIELSLFADKSILAEFEPLARKDRQQFRRSASFRRTRPRSQSLRKTDPVEVSYDTWNVLQIDSHDDRLDKAGARVRELSAPLAEAGISILYQSSYMSDFIFVKASRLTQVLSRLAHAGFVRYSFDLTSQLSGTHAENHDVHPFFLDSQANSHTPLHGLTRPRPDPAFTPLVLQRHQAPNPARHSSPASETPTATPTPPASTFSRRASMSPCPGDVQILHQDLACVGLAESCTETWASKIIKLVAYPELISTATTKTRGSDPFENWNPMSSLDDLAEFDSNVLPSSPLESLARDTWSPSASNTDSASSLATSPSSSDEDGYFSSTSPYSTSDSTPSPLSPSRSYSYPEICDSSAALSATAVLVGTRPPLTPLTTATGPASASPSGAAAEALCEKAVPFFSFTRTAEGSSLTTGVGLIATLFPPSERHMVICSNELGMTGDDDLARRHLQGGASSPVTSTMKCLQIDLQRFGLDKHGLINRFSKVLDSNGINHMYSSSYKTANLLVRKTDAVRAQALLRSC